VAKGEDAAAIHAAVEALNQEFQEASRRAYEASAAAQQQAAAAGGGAAGPSAGPTEGTQGPGAHDDVIDADFTAEDDKK
jgi:hypothetical protein